jgi:hypothetical protein
VTDSRFIVPLSLALCGFALAPASPDPHPDKAPDVGTAYQVPYRLTATNHYLVRVKVNGKGPFNFLVDTGAPYLFVSTDVAKKIDLKPAPDGEYWTAIDTFDLEGGAKLTKLKARVEDPFQLVGMNAMGLPGATIDGILGYTILARFKMEFDPTKDRMTWTRLDFDPKEPFIPKNAQIREDSGVKAMNALGPAMKIMSIFTGKQPEDMLHPQGIIGIEFDHDLKITAVLKGSPAEKAGLQVGDKITKLVDTSIKAAKDTHEAIAKIKKGDVVKIAVERDAKTIEVTATAEEGL